MPGHALILGSTGRFGQNAAKALTAAGWTVTPFRRGRDDLRAMARGADLVVNGWNPPYTVWEQAVPDLTQTVIGALRGTNATVVVPGNVYVFGPDATPPWGPETPHLADNPLGRIRIAMEEAYRASGLRTIVLRGGDFLDTRASGNWFDRIMIKSLDKGVLSYPGDPTVPHAWAFLPDITRAMAELAEQRATLPDFCDVPFPGYTLCGQDMATMLGRVAGREIKVKRMSWLPIRALSPVWPMGRKLCEMRYLWTLPHALDGTVFNRLLPGFEHTPVEDALAQSVQGAGFATRSTQTSRWRLASSAAS